MFESHSGRRCRLGLVHFHSLHGTILCTRTLMASGRYFQTENCRRNCRPAKLKKQVISEALNWNPLARFYLQANFSYTLNQTDTPANDINLFTNASPTVTNFRSRLLDSDQRCGLYRRHKTNIYTDFHSTAPMIIFDCCRCHALRPGGNRAHRLSHDHSPINQANALAPEIRIIIQRCDLWRP